MFSIKKTPSSSHLSLVTATTLSTMALLSLLLIYGIVVTLTVVFPTISTLVKTRESFIVEHLKENIEGFFHPFKETVSFLETLVTNTPSLFTLVPTLIANLHNHPSCEGLTITLKNHTFVHIERHKSLYHVTLYDSLHQKFHSFVYDRTSESVHALSTPSFSQNNRPPWQEEWYQDARTTRKNQWAPPYVRMHEHPKVFTTLAHPFDTPDEAFGGIIALHIDITPLSDHCARFIKESVFSAFIFSPKGQLIAYPERDKLFHYEKGSLALENMDRITDYPLKELLISLRNPAEDAPKDPTVFRSVSLHTPKGLKEALVIPLSLDAVEGQKWFLGTIVSGEKTLGLVHYLTHLLIWGGSLVFFLAFIGTLYLSRSIVRPVLRVQKRLQSLQNLHFEDDNTLSLFHETKNMLRDVSHLQKALEAFGKFVPKEYVRFILTQNKPVTLGGTKKIMTVFFADLEDSTHISETMVPSAFVEHLSESFDAMTRLITQEKGTLDKYIGDEMMAFWGAPQEDPDHAIHSCRAALLCQQHLHACHALWKEEHRPCLRFRFGIHTGPMLVGIFGSSERFQYSIMGDTVNTASRLQSLNKVYGTTLLVGEATYHLAKDHFVFRPVDTVKLRGQEETPLMIYELLDAYAHPLKDSSTLAHHVALALHTQSAFEAYQTGNIHQALRLYQESAPYDALSAVMVVRCQNLMPS